MRTKRAEIAASGMSILHLSSNIAKYMRRSVML